jgi:hypothetical protein
MPDGRCDGGSDDTGGSSPDQCCASPSSAANNPARGTSAASVDDAGATYPYTGCTCSNYDCKTCAAPDNGRQ